MNNNDPITDQEWEQLAYWRRKKLYFLARYIVVKCKIKKFIQLWALPNFAVRQIRMDQGSPITVNDESTEQADMTEWKRLYSLSTPEERLETMLLMLAVIEARQAPTAANTDDEEHVKAMSEESGLCEACGKRQGETNSRYLFLSPISDPDCGDWVCLECEQQAEQDYNEEMPQTNWQRIEDAPVSTETESGGEPTAI